MSNGKIIAAGKVLLPDPGDGLQICAAVIEIRESRIERIEKTSVENLLTLATERAKETGYSCEVFPDRMITPAFVNAHTHLAMSFFRGLSSADFASTNMIEDFFYHIESRLTHEDVRAFTRMGAFESLLGGTGFVWDHYYFGVAVAEGLQDVGLPGVVAPTLQDVAGPGVRLLEKSLQDTLDLTGTSWTQAGIFPALGPHATDTVSEGLWKKIAEISIAKSLPVHAHVAQSAEEYDRSQAAHGVSPVEWLERLGLLEEPHRLLAVHGIYISDSDLTKLSPERNLLVFCPYSQMVFQFPAGVDHWEKAGLPWCVATDCAASNDSMHVQKELRFVAGLPYGNVTAGPAYQKFLNEGGIHNVTACRAERKKQDPLYARLSESAFLLRKILTVPGQFYPGIKTGEIKVGALANLVMWDVNHPSFWSDSRNPLRALAMSDVTGAIENVMTLGQWRGETGNFQRSLLASPEYRDAFVEAEKRLSELKKRAGL